jgi:hypothetical protein
MPSTRQSGTAVLFTVWLATLAGLAALILWDVVQSLLGPVWAL